MTIDMASEKRMAEFKLAVTEKAAELHLTADEYLTSLLCVAYFFQEHRPPIPLPPWMADLDATPQR